jgi:RNA polymerase sigma factor (TIGR02999 family)
MQAVIAVPVHGNDIRGEIASSGHAGAGSGAGNRGDGWLESDAGEGGVRMKPPARQGSAWHAGDAAAVDALVPEVYGELRRIARRLMRGQSAAHTLQPTALANEAWLKLAGSDADVNDRVHFFAIAARAMRQVLVDHARGLARDKRDGGARISLTLANGEVLPADERLLLLEAELGNLEHGSPRAARITELHYFGGMNYEEIGTVLGLSKATVDRELRFARAWLAARLDGP